MQGFAQEAPAFHAAACFIKVDPNAFVVRLFERQSFCCFCVFFELCEDLVPVACEILAYNRDPDLPFVRRIFQLRDDAVDLLALPEQLRRFDDDLRGKVRAVVKEEVLLQRSMSRCLDSQLAVDSLFVELDSFVDDVPVPSSVSEVLQAQSILDKFCQLAAGDAVRHHRRARMLLCHEGCRHGNDAVSGDLPPAAVHRCRTVYVCIEDQAQIRAASYGLQGDGVDGFFVFRVRRVVHEHAVRLQELAGADVRTQRLQHSGRKESAAAVSCVDDDLHAFQRPLSRADTIDDQLPQEIAVGCHDIVFLCFENELAQPVGLHPRARRFADLRDLRILVRCVFKNLCNIFFIESAVTCKELKSVPVVRQMAGCDHDRSVAFEILEDGCHEHGRRGRVAEVVDFASVFPETVHESVEQPRPGCTRIPSDRQRHILRPFAQLVRKPDDEADGDFLGLIFSEAEGLSGNARQRYASDIAAVLKFQVFLSLVGSHSRSPLLLYEKRCHF